jgi:predicted dehydrogenase
MNQKEADKWIWPLGAWIFDRLNWLVVGMSDSSPRECSPRYTPSRAAGWGAAINDTGAHAIDLLTWLNGSKVKRAVGVAKRLAMPETYTLCDDTALVMVEFENGAFGTIGCNRFSPAVNQVTELCGTEGTIFTATDATNLFQSWPMAVYTSKPYSVETLPKILKDYRWPELFWVEDIIHKNVRNRWVPICPPRSALSTGGPALE